MRLIFIDTETQQAIVNLPVVIKDEQYFVDTSSSVYKTFDFMIDCALYCINDGDMTFGTYDNENDKPLAEWYLIENYCEVAEVENGFVAQFFDDDDCITHDSFYPTWKEVEQGCDTYIKAGLFGSYVS